MSNLALFIWGGTLGIVVLVIVPLALSLLSRALRNARSIEHYLSEYTPAAQAHLIDEIKTGISLLEELVSKNNTIEVSSIN